MDVQATSGAEAQQAQQKNGLNGTQKLADDFDAFLNLLVTQLKNQDPLEPMKSQEFTNQLVQFSGVEQQLATNDKLDSLVDLQNGSRAGSAVNYIGREIEAAGNQLSLQDGSASFAYELNDNAAGAVIQIANGEGNVVRTLEAETTAGRHEMTWDGTDEDGNALPDGAYTMNLLAVDAENKTVQGTTSVFGRVTGVETSGDGVLLNIGDIGVDLNKVKAIHETSGQSA
ncbi:flagellar hook assembly protein FlgD [Ferruginivarius sediminum]|uniref:Basal-body rod modification protein FlgD n=1 Tax=Ferruginivarius sediminum TaxID=2661937 RepID=A0A369TFQ0_9PROT|nr:flagellar hook assembly protein FlgD [Ferruginivarius sediminum]RDD63642.1 flagellar hook assembly protein FlgD [Ferruginivarius sediminum]